MRLNVSDQQPKLFKEIQHICALLLRRANIKFVEDDLVASPLNDLAGG